MTQLVEINLDDQTGIQNSIGRIELSFTEIITNRSSTVTCYPTIEFSSGETRETFRSTRSLIPRGAAGTTVVAPIITLRLTESQSAICWKWDPREWLPMT